MRFEILTPRLRLQHFREEDFETTFEMLSDTEVMRFIESGARSSNEARAEFSCYRRDWEYQDWGMWAMESRDSGEIVGICGFSGYDSLGCVLKRDARGKGFATEATFACLKFGFERLHREEIGANTLKANLASIRLFQRIGMTQKQSDDSGKSEEIRLSITRDSPLPAQHAIWDEFEIIEIERDAQKQRIP